jgi:hypothetical protein
MTGRFLIMGLSPSRLGPPQGENAPIRGRLAFHAPPLGQSLTESCEQTSSPTQGQRMKDLGPIYRTRRPV